MIQLHVTYTMKTGIHPKAFFDALNKGCIPFLVKLRFMVSFIISFLIFLKAAILVLSKHIFHQG